MNPRQKILVSVHPCRNNSEKLNVRFSKGSRRGHAPIALVLLKCTLNWLFLFIPPMSCTLVFLLLSVEHFYTFWLEVLYQICVLQIFSPVYGLFFFLLTVSFEEQRFLPLIKSNLSFFSSMDGALGIVSKKQVVTIFGVRFRKSKMTIFSSRNVINLSFVFRSAIHYELIFV